MRGRRARQKLGTWHDGDARQVWDFNDFDEAAVMPYALDLLRLVVSARLAPDFSVDPGDVAETVMDGYRHGLQGPRPVLLDQGARWLCT